MHHEGKREYDGYIFTRTNWFYNYRYYSNYSSRRFDLYDIQIGIIQMTDNHHAQVQSEKKVVDIDVLVRFLIWSAFVGIGIYNYYTDITNPDSTIIVKLLHVQLPMLSMMMDGFLLMYFGFKAWSNSYFIMTEKEQSQMWQDELWR